MIDWQNVILYVYFSLLAILFFYGFHGYILGYLFNKHYDKNRDVQKPLQQRPFVTVQLPIYNEQYVVERLLKSCINFAYPKDRFEIQVLDDSTDITANLTRQLVEKYKDDGYQIEWIHRTIRTGFKAGALRNGLQYARGEFIAIFDADFLPDRDFLANTLCHFDTPEIGMVQTRWGHLNGDYSLLTRTQALALDNHFMVEQTVRYHSGFFFNFNGTAGVWRKSCIEDAGNWQDDTLTEDLDLSYRAQIKGWKFKFLPNVISPAELPSEINALKSQQFRWTKGAVETSRKILPYLWKEKAVSLAAKLQGTLHLTNNYVYPLILLIALSNLPLLLLKEYGHIHKDIFNVFPIFLVAFFGNFVQSYISQKAIYKDWKRRLLLFPVFMSGCMGFSINNSKAVIEGILKKKSGFIRTPKFDIVNLSDSWIGKNYLTNISVSLVWEFIVTVYCFITLCMGIFFMEVKVLPFLVMFAFGFGSVFYLSLKHYLAACAYPRTA